MNSVWPTLLLAIRAGRKFGAQFMEIFRGHFLSRNVNLIVEERLKAQKLFVYYQSYVVDIYILHGLPNFFLMIRKFTHVLAASRRLIIQ